MEDSAKYLPSDDDDNDDGNDDGDGSYGLIFKR
jgi:hypothetical protein